MLVKKQSAKEEPPKAKACGRCRVEKPIKHFGICRARKDGHNLYCKSCVIDIVHAQRDRKRAMKRARKRAQDNAKQELAEFQRKPNIVSPIVHTPLSKVWFAVQNGHRTRMEIKNATGLDFDAIGDALATLAFDRNDIRLVKIDGDFHAIAA